VFLSEKEDFVSFEYCDDFDLKTQLFKPKDITHNSSVCATKPVLVSLIETNIHDKAKRIGAGVATYFIGQGFASGLFL
jgi:hypothetical protein